MFFSSSIKFQVMWPISVAGRVEVTLSPQCYYTELGHQWSPKEGANGHIVGNGILLSDSVLNMQVDV